MYIRSAFVCENHYVVAHSVCGIVVSVIRWCTQNAENSCFRCGNKPIPGRTRAEIHPRCMYKTRDALSLQSCAKYPVRYHEIMHLVTISTGIVNKINRTVYVKVLRAVISIHMRAFLIPAVNASTRRLHLKDGETLLAVMTGFRKRYLSSSKIDLSNIDTLSDRTWLCTKFSGLALDR